MEELQQNQQMCVLNLEDQEGNKYSLIVSAADYVRAQSDHEYQQQLFAAFILENLPPGTSAEEPVTECNIVQSEICEGGLLDSSQQVNTGGKWQPAAVLAVITKFSDLTTGGVATKTTWAKMALYLQQLGYEFTAAQVASKWDTLKRRYKKIKDEEGKSGAGRMRWEYFDALDNIFARKHWVNPPAEATSDGPPASPPAGRSAAENEENATPGGSTKKRKFEEFLGDFQADRKAAREERRQERKEREEERERSKERRHEERLAVQRGLLAAIENLAK